MAPATKSKLFSGQISKILRFLIVTFLPPILPAIFFPFHTLEGSFHKKKRNLKHVEVATQKKKKSLKFYLPCTTRTKRSMSQRNTMRSWLTFKSPSLHCSLKPFSSSLFFKKKDMFEKEEIEFSSVEIFTQRHGRPQIDLAKSDERTM